jgi:1-deoxy-D-xylulose-5-phosphate synthase
VDREMLEQVLPECSILVTMEENITAGGYGQMVASVLADNYMEKYGSITHIDASIHAGKVEQGSIDILRKMLAIDAQSIYERIKAALAR